MNKQLLLESVRGVLARLEETIIFALIERAQFRRNDVIYVPGAFGDVLQGESLCGYMLHETERIHARMRRYTSPDENPFFPDLPAPILPPLYFSENPLVANTVNLNAELRRIYEHELVPHLCAEGDDKQYGSSSLCDVACLQSLSKRVHYGKFVAESKYRSDPERFSRLIRAGEADALMVAITDEEAEDSVLERVGLKAQAYARDVGNGNEGAAKLNPELVVDIYSRWIIPMNKEVQVRYLLERGK